MNVQLPQGEVIIKEGAANLQKGIETVGGKLRLTNQRLLFKAHKLNVLGGTTEIELTDIKSSHVCWTKLFGLIPFVPNSLAVLTNDGNEYRFVLFDRKAWVAAIDAQKNG